MQYCLHIKGSGRKVRKEIPLRNWCQLQYGILQGENGCSNLLMLASKTYEKTQILLGEVNASSKRVSFSPWNSPQSVCRVSWWTRNPRYAILISGWRLSVKFINSRNMRVCVSKLTQSCSTSVARPAVVRNSMALRRAASLFAKPVSQQLGFTGQPLAGAVGFTKSRRISTTVFAAQEERLNGTSLN
jgi:hypothetical protein